MAAADERIADDVANAADEGSEDERPADKYEYVWLNRGDFKKGHKFGYNTYDYACVGTHIIHTENGALPDHDNIDREKVNWKATLQEHDDDIARWLSGEQRFITLGCIHAEWDVQEQP